MCWNLPDVPEPAVWRSQGPHQPQIWPALHHPQRHLHEGRSRQGRSASPALLFTFNGVWLPHFGLVFMLCDGCECHKVCVCLVLMLCYRCKCHKVCVFFFFYEWWCSFFWTFFQLSCGTSWRSCAWILGKVMPCVYSLVALQRVFQVRGLVTNLGKLPQRKW